jgi:hypothetical protein
MQEQRINKYNKHVVAEDFLLVSNYNSVMELPTFLRAVINTTSKEYLTEKKQSINALAACFLLSGQKSIPTRAKKSIAGFKLREGTLLGCRTTLRKKRLYTILDKLLIFVLPRLDFEGGKSGILQVTTKNKTCLKRHKDFYLLKNSHSKTLPFESDCNLPFSVEGTLTKDEDTQSYNPYNGCNVDNRSLSQKERDRLNANLECVERNKTATFIKEKGITCKGQIYYLAFGIHDLLLMPELQEFLPLFEGVRGINLGISFFNPSIKTTLFDYLPLPTKQGNAGEYSGIQGQNKLKGFVGSQLEKIINLGEKVKGLRSHQYPTISPSVRSGGIRDSEELKVLTGGDESAHVAFNSNSVQRQQTEGILSFPFAKGTVEKRLENRRRYTLQYKGFSQKQYLREQHHLKTFYALADTAFSKENRRVLFLTSFQYPRRYT